MTTPELLHEQAAMRERMNPAPPQPEEADLLSRVVEATDETIPENRSKAVDVYVRHGANCKGRNNKYCGCSLALYDRYTQKRLSTRFPNTSEEMVARAQKEANRIMDSRDPDKKKIADFERQREYESILIEKAVKEYIEDCRERGLAPETIEAYECTCEQMRDFMHSKQVYALGEITPDLMKAWRKTWTKLGIIKKSAKNKTQRQIKTFFKYACEQARWLKINDNPALALTVIQGEEDVPAIAFYDGQFEAIIDATYIYEDSNRFRDAALRLRALILLMRWSGLAIRDALTLPTWRIDEHGVLKAQRTKTKVWLELPLPADVIEVLTAAAKINDNPEYFFWNGTAKPRSLVGNYNRMLKRLFSLVKWPHPIIDGNKKPIAPHSHMFRHTFAYWWLNTINPQTGLMGDIRHLQLLLGHQKLATTEKHYSGYVPAQNEWLHNEVRARHAVQAGPKKPQSSEHHIRVRVKQTSHRGEGRGRFAR